MTHISNDLQRLIGQVQATEEKLERITFCAYTLLRVLGHEQPRIVTMDAETASAQLIEALRS